MGCGVVVGLSLFWGVLILNLLFCCCRPEKLIYVSLHTNAVSDQSQCPPPPPCCPSKNNPNKQRQNRNHWHHRYTAALVRTLQLTDLCKALLASTLFSSSSPVCLTVFQSPTQRENSFLMMTTKTRLTLPARHR